MKLLIMSDTHGDREIINRVKKFYPDTEVIIHCGDSELDYKDEIFHQVHGVKGNCDDDAEFPNDFIIESDGKRIYVTHGHLYNVKSTLMPLSYRAQEVHADIVCFGHSHVLGAEKIGDTLFINPGSLKQPRGRKEKTFVVVEIVDNQYVVNCFDEHNNLLEEVSIDI